MLREMMLGKIHRATVTGAKLDYVGSITVDSTLLEASGILPGQKVDVVDVTNGARLSTYTISGQAGSGTIQLNGAAAHLVHEGDLVIIIAYGQLSDEELADYTQKVVFVDDRNHIVEVGHNAGLVPEGYGLHSSAQPE